MHDPDRPSRHELLRRQRSVWAGLFLVALLGLPLLLFGVPLILLGLGYE